MHTPDYSNVRSLGEVKKLGNWRSDASVRRYEKSGRLNLSMQRLSAAQRSKFDAVKQGLEVLFMRGT